MDNPSCPRCGHYNAMLNGVCRDCGARRCSVDDCQNAATPDSVRGLCDAHHAAVMAKHAEEYEQVRRGAEESERRKTLRDRLRATLPAARLVPDVATGQVYAECPCVRPDGITPCDVRFITAFDVEYGQWNWSKRPGDRLECFRHGPCRLPSNEDAARAMAEVL